MLVFVMYSKRLSTNLNNNKHRFRNIYSCKKSRHKKEEVAPIYKETASLLKDAYFIRKRL